MLFMVVVYTLDKILQLNSVLRGGDQLKQAYNDFKRQERKEYIKNKNILMRKIKKQFQLTYLNFSSRFYKISKTNIQTSASKSQTGPDILTMILGELASTNNTNDFKISISRMSLIDT